MFVQSRHAIREEAGQRLVVRSQEITKDFLDDLHNERMAKATMKRGDHDRVASVPTALIDSWLARGIDFWSMSAREVVQLLEKEDMRAFITATGRV